MNEMKSILKTDRKNAVVTGVFFIMATTTAIISLILYGPVLNQPGNLAAGAANPNQIVLGAVFELILACSNVGTAIMLFPYLRKFSESWGLGYVCFRVLEVVFILVGIVSVLALLSLSREFTNAGAADAASFHTVEKILKAIHDWTFILGPNFLLGVNTFIYSHIFYQSKLVPRKLAILGIVGSVLILNAALLEMFGAILQISVWGVLLALPVAVYEMALAAWLIIKGFNKQAYEPVRK
jgi:hypothetical protein